MAVRFDCDVIVVGAGMVGATLAQALAEAGIRVAVVDRAPTPPVWREQGYGQRVSAINRGSEYLLRSLGVWPAIQRRRISSYDRMFVWDAGSDAKIEFDSAGLGVSHLGSIVENDLIVFALNERLSAMANVKLLHNTGVEDVRHADDGISVKLSTAESLRARVLVGADGAQSRVRSLLGIRSKARSFGQRAIVARVGTELDHQRTAWQRFLGTGPLAFLPLSNGDSSIVWSSAKSFADDIMALDDTAFMRRLTEAFDSRLGAVIRTGARTTFPLSSAHASSYVGDRSVLVGDAAHVVHPLAGQGVNLGFADAAALAEVMVDARADHRDIGGRMTLRRYERWRKGDNLIMVNAMRGLNKLFGTDSWPMVRLRGAGLGLTDSIDPLKHAFANKAMGLGGDLPRRMRREYGAGH